MPEIIQKRANYYRKVVADKKNEGGKVKWTKNAKSF
jgi:hypothetical protein